MGIKHKVNEKFFEKWSPTMAYVLGYIYADGNLIDDPYMRGKYISVTSVDVDSILRIRNWLKSEHKLRKTRSHFAGSRDCYLLRIGSHKIYDDLFTLGLRPNKSLTIDFPEIPKKYLWHFIRGYFDGDGCIYFERRMGKNKKLIVKRIRVIFTSGSKIFLESMSKKLIDFGLEKGKIYLSKRSYQLVYNNKDSLLFFKLVYKNTGKNSFFMRKFKVFEEYLKLRPSNVDRGIKKILGVHTGHVVK